MRHCEHCGVCINEQYHHCKLYGKCIGSNNQFCFYGSVGMVVVNFVLLGLFLFTDVKGHAIVNNMKEIQKKYTPKIKKGINKIQKINHDYWYPKEEKKEEEPNSEVNISDGLFGMLGGKTLGGSNPALDM